MKTKDIHIRYLQTSLVGSLLQNFSDKTCYLIVMLCHIVLNCSVNREQNHKLIISGVIKHFNADIIVVGGSEKTAPVTFF